MLSLSAFLAVTLALIGGYSLLTDVYFRDRTRVAGRIDDEFRKRQRIRVEKTSLFKDLGRFAAEAHSGERRRGGLKVWLHELVEQSGLDIEPRKLIMIAVGVGSAIGLVVGLIGRGPVPALVATPIGFAGPFVYVMFKRKARINKLRSQLPDAFDLIARVLRAGQTLGQGLLAVSEEFPPPIAAEFSYCYEQQNLGLSTEAAYRDLARRSGLVELKIFVLGLIIQQQTGGNLADLVDKLAALLRDRERIRGSVQALTAEGRMQAMILMGLPPALYAIMLVMNGPYAMQLFSYPKLLLGCAGMMGVGALWIRKIINFDF